jgi:hypothetical protein
MKITNVFQKFLKSLNNKFPEIFSERPIDEADYKQFEDTFFNDASSILTRSDSLFSEDRIIFGGNLSTVWEGLESDDKTMIWKHLQSCCIHSFLHGDIKTKLLQLFEAIKPLISSSDEFTDEIDSILGKEETKNKFVEILEYLKQSRIFTVFTSVFESIDLSGLNVDDIDPTDIESLKSNESLQKIQKEIGTMLQTKLSKGEFSQAVIVAEIQTLTVKFQEIFGDSLNEMIGATHKGPDGKTALSNSPEARRARMMARLKRKAEDKK